MKKIVTGLHHVTALTSEAQHNLDFYAGILGLRMVKKTINYDAPEVYHLYYGDEFGTPGTILTFFVYPGLPKGKKGIGQLTVTSFSIGENALDYWIRRLDKFGVKHSDPQVRFKTETYIYFEDHEGFGLELVVNKEDERRGYGAGNILPDLAIKGFHSVTLSEECTEKTAGLLTGLMDHALVNQDDKRFRYAAGEQKVGFVDLLCSPDALQGIGGAGTTHHVAFATPTQATQVEARSKLIKNGFNVTPVIDRRYFHSIYYREPGGVLFEIATLPPGFAIDEEPSRLGEALTLPPWEEKHRKSIEKWLQPIHLDLQKFKD